MNKLRTVVVDVLHYLLKKVFVPGLVLSLIVGFSFIITGGFNIQALSERLFWAGIFVILLAGMIVLAISLTGKSLGIPTRARKPEEARVLLDRHLEVRDAIEKRYNAGIQLWLIGLVCVALSALVQSFGSK